MQKALLLSVFFILSKVVFSAEPDSLKKVALNQQDSALADTYYELVKYYFIKDHQPDSMIRYARLAIKISEKNSLTSRLIKSLKVLGVGYTEAQQIPQAKETLLKALTIARSQNISKEIIDINDKIGYMFAKNNQPDSSVYYYLNSAKEYEKNKDYKGLTEAYYNVMVLFRLQNQLKEIAFYSKKTLEAASRLSESSDAVAIAAAYSRVAQNYFLIAEKSENKNYFDSAWIYADRCLEVSKKYGIREREADAYYIYSHKYRIAKNYEKTIEYSKKVLEFRDVLPERKLFNMYISLAQSYYEFGDTKKALLYIDSCYILNSSKDDDAPLLLAELEHLLYKKNGNYEKALDAYERYVALKQEIQDQERNKNMNDLEVKYQTELKESKINELNKQSEIDTLKIRSLIGFAGFAILIIVIIIAIYRQRLIKNKLKQIETEQRLNRARMDPHFFFNVLTSIQTLVMEKTDAASASLMISKFSKIMRESLESSYNELITVEEEISFLTHYLDLQKMRYPEKFTYTFEINNNLDVNELLVPGMILQPFIENSIEHGFKNIDYKGRIDLKFRKDGEALVITIKDNGSGLGKSKEHKSYPSRATQIITDRLYLLNIQHGSNARFDITSENGTEINVYLPLISN